MLSREFPHDGLVVFDELHKYSRWRNFLKGLYDPHGLAMQILVTGSARLDLYRRGGDSLQGRYHHLRLYPFSLREAKCSLEDLMAFGPFPDLCWPAPPPLPGGGRESTVRASSARTSPASSASSSSERSSALCPAAEPGRLAAVAERAARRCPVAHKTVERWVDILERVMFLFRLDPFGPPRIKAVKKSRKHYLFDWTTVEDAGARFENLVAFHLLKECHYLEDVEGHDTELRFFRDVEGREVDFVQMKNGKPVRFVECKLADTAINPALLYLRGSSRPSRPCRCWRRRVRTGRAKMASGCSVRIGR